MKQERDPRADPVGTVRSDPDGTVAVKVVMGGSSGKGQHVWVVTDEQFNHIWLHHIEVNDWMIVHHPTVVDFCAERAGFITAINNCHPDNVSDYHRWQGNAEARRQLSERLGLPVAWPAEVSQ